MKTILDRYLDRVLLYANRPEAETGPIRQELKDHLLQKIDDLAASGMPREEAMLEALRQHGSPKAIGYQLRAPFPWIDIRTQGTARGVIAIGPRAVGIFAFGGVAVGVVAMGGVAAGLFSMGGLALGLIFAWAGMGIGGIVYAGCAVGLVATGGFALGVVAQGGFVIGLGSSDFLKTMATDLFESRLCTMLMSIFIPFFIGGILGLNYLQYREQKRLASEENWLIDG